MSRRRQQDSRSADALAPSVWRNRIVRGDGLAVAHSLPARSLDLIYLDPPFGTGREWRALRCRGNRFGLNGVSAFEDPTGPDEGPPGVPGPVEEPGRRASAPGRDQAQGSPPALRRWLPSWLASLLVESLRLLRPGGALVVHLDWRRAPYARLFLDRLYGEDHFLNEIIWRYATGGVPRDRFARKHDTLLYYRNGEGHTFHRKQEKKYLAHRMSRRGVEEFHDEKGWYRYRYLDDVWEIPWLTQDARERTGYPTQKPVALLTRIIETTTDPGDRVADFCCGSGTSLVAAHRLGRLWIGVDRSHLAVQIADTRLRAEGWTQGMSRGSVPPPGTPPVPGESLRSKGGTNEPGR